MSKAAEVMEGEVEAKKAVAKVRKVEIAPPAKADNVAPLIQMVERLALNPNANPDQIERFLAMQERILAQQAERDFNDAMARAQAEMRPVAADADNQQTKSKYATYAALDRALRPIYTKHGFAPSFNTGDGAPEGHVRVVCDLTNSGHTRRYKLDMPADGKGAKGGDVMTKTHATGSAVQYGMRYLLKMMFNVAVGDADDDGNKAGGSVITDEQAAKLAADISDTNADVTKFLRYFKIESLSDMPAKRFQEAVRLLDERRQK